MTVNEIEAARAATPGCGEVIHLDHAGSSLPPQTVLDAQIGHLWVEATIGGYEAAAATDRCDAVYDSIGALVGARSHEIARMEHATAAWNAAFWSVPMEPGQTIVVHDHEYGANIVGLPTNGGLVNPAADIGALTRAAGVPFLLDKCQSVGQLNIDVGEIGCDLLSATGRKYLRGPRGTGFLYVSDAIVERLTPSQPDHHGTELVASDRFEWRDGARRFEYWEHSVAGWLGLGAAVDHALGWGIDRIEVTVTERAEQLRASPPPRTAADVGALHHDDG